MGLAAEATSFENGTKTCITSTYVGKNDTRKWLETAAIMGMCILDLSGPPRYFKNLAGSQTANLQRH